MTRHAKRCARERQHHHSQRPPRSGPGANGEAQPIASDTGWISHDECADDRPHPHADPAEAAVASDATLTSRPSAHFTSRPTHRASPPPRLATAGERETTRAPSTLAKGIAAELQDDDPGAKLRRAREARGLTVEDVTRLTKVSTATVIALEHNDVTRLPATVFTRGFVKAYAGEVGLDPDRTANEYLARIDPVAVHPLPADNGILARVNESVAAAAPVNDDRRHLPIEHQLRRFGRLATAGAVLGFVLYVWSFAWQQDRSEQRNILVNLPASAGGVDAAASAQSTADGVPIPAGPLRVELQPQGPCWLSANVDGTVVVAKLLQAGEGHTLEASEELVLRVGDPGALSVSINGRAARPLGRAGRPVNVRITRENFRDFLSS